MDKLNFEIELELKFYKNFKEICNALGINVLNGNAKKSLIKKIDSLYEYKRIGNGYLIIKKRDKPKEIIDMRGKTGNNKKQIKNFNITEDKWCNIGVYIIIDKNNNCYIRSTIVGFRNRFLGHYSCNNKLMKYTYDLLHKNNAKFKILEDMTGKSEQEIREKENYYIQLYKNDDKYTLINHMLYVGGVKPKKIKKKIIKIDSDKYDQAIELLKENGLLN